MANDFYQIYRADVMRLAKTMVIKSELSAVATNRALVEKGFAVSADKSTWRYYMNIAGLYHSTNSPMQVVSQDTGEIIDFTVENLKIHRATAREYAYGSRYYNTLKNQYKRQESLILGILNPVPMAKAIAAREYEILWIDPLLIDSNEESFQQLVQNQIYAAMDRWHVEMYSFTEDLYDWLRFELLFTNLPQFIMVARTQLSRTIQSHSFHIRQFLASNGQLDVYMDAMTKKQQLFFYRNLTYLHRFPGHTSSFNLLVQKVLEDRQFPLADYTMIQNVSDMPNSVEPTVELVRRETTADYAGVAPTKVSVLSVLQKQVKLARSNGALIGDNETETTSLMLSAKSSTVQTKVLESSVLDMTDSQIYRLEDFLLNNWVYLSANERYRALVTFANPRTGVPVQLTALDAFILFLFAYNRSMGQDLPLVPNINAICVPKTPAPTPAEMLDKMGTVGHSTLEVAIALWDMLPPIGTFTSTDAFYNAIYALYIGAMDQQTVASFQGNYNSRAEAEAMGMYMFQDVFVNLADEIPTAQWLNVRGLDSVLDFSQAELDDLWTNLLSKATGMDLNTTMSLNDIHRAMIGIMSRLSSYTVQYLREINDGPLKPLAVKFIRFGDSDSAEEATHNWDLLKLKEFTSKGSSWNRSDMTKLEDYPIIKREVSGEGNAFMKVGLEFEQNTTAQGYSEWTLPTLRMFDPVLRPPTDLSNLSGTSELRLAPLEPALRDIRELITVTTLSGLNYPNRLT
jgi:hypothetical protein